jgi:NAD+ synthase (glutamine-hydrolysing)
MKTVRVALCQMNPTVGYLDGNLSAIIEWIGKASAFDPDLIVFPELAITGYPPEDLLLKPQFIEDNIAALRQVLPHVLEPVVIVGFVDKRDDIFNAAALIHQGEVVDVYHKVRLPNYGVFDEVRYFQAGRRCPVYQLGTALFGVTICEDIWFPEGPATAQALGGAEFVININASPYHMGKQQYRERMLATRASDSSVIVAYLNMVGGQDELVFDGHSLIIDQHGGVVATGRQFDEDLIVADLNLDGVFMKRLHDPRRRQQVLALGEGAVEKIVIPTRRRPGSGDAPKSLGRPCAAPLETEDEVFSALVLGVRDYVRKNGFRKVCVGLSGGIDSALVAVIAADAIGRDNVVGVFMPSPFTSQESRDDVEQLAEQLGIELREVSISEVFESYLKTFAVEFKSMPADTTEENIQARIRGNILMAFSNKFGWLVLTTGNKSEMSVGYATLYGDMAGGFAVIKDVPKTLVYRLSRWRNAKAGRTLIPERVITKAPTAELKPGQKDTDTLPPYDVLDPILRSYIEEERSFGEIVRAAPEETAKKVITMVDTSEYKRRQSPPGIKITPRAFGRDRRFPITNRYRSW